MATKAIFFLVGVVMLSFFYKNIEVQFLAYSLDVNVIACIAIKQNFFAKGVEIKEQNEVYLLYKKSFPYYWRYVDSKGPIVFFF